jgi:hypothetical protein
MKVKAQIDEWELMHEDIWYKIYKKWINITVAHKICNQTNGIEIRRISRNENIRLKKKFNDCIFPFFKKVGIFVRARCSHPTKEAALGYLSFK